MFGDPNELYLGNEVYNDEAAIHFVDHDNDIHDDIDEIDPDLFDNLWTISADETGLDFFDHDTGESALFLGHGEATFGGGISLGGDMQNINVTDDTIRLSGFDTLFEFRRSESDWDQIFELRRQGNSDYEMWLHHGGSPREMLTTHHDIDAATFDGDGPETFLRGGMDVRNDGSLAATDVRAFDFGTDLGVTVTTQGVEVEYVGSTVPSRVYDDGDLVLEDANGIDFRSDLNVVIGANNVAEVRVDTPSGMLDGSEDENITGTWTFQEHILGSIDEADYATVAGTANALSSAVADTFVRRTIAQTIAGTHTHEARLRMANNEEFSYGDDDSFRQWRSSSNSNLVMTHVDQASEVVRRIIPSTGTASYEYDLESGGDPVATETWVENEAPVASTTQANTFSADQTFTAGVDASDGDYIAFPTYTGDDPDTTNMPDGAGWFRADEV